MFNLKAYLQEKKIEVDHELASILLEGTTKGRLSDAMTYAVMAGGKRLRPILCIAASEAVGGTNPDAALTVACALELIHTYSLIHDDLPAMDDDALRRGKPTCHIAFDEATAILAGDALLTLAFQVLAKMDAQPGITLEARLLIIQCIAEAAGAKGMVEGQMLDVSSEGDDLFYDDLKRIHRLKTGELISASVTCGAVLGNATSLQTENLRAYAKSIGMAFQLTDDILNVEGDASQMGKAVGTDEARNKNTFPSLIGMAASKEMAQRLVDSALQSLSIFDIRSEPLSGIARYIIERRN